MSSQTRKKIVVFGATGTIGRAVITALSPKYEVVQVGNRQGEFKADYTSLVRAFQAIDGNGLARVDFFLRPEGALVLNEINTMPGLTDVSGFPKMWEATGVPFPRAIDRLIELAVERHRERARNETSI